MPSVGDTIRIKIISEQQGVSMTNLLFFEVDDLGTDGPVVDQLNDFGVQFLAAITAQMATTWAITCLIYSNIFAAEAKAAVFTNLPGTSGNTPHPPHLVARFNQYANDVPQTAQKTGAFSLSGTHITSSNKGRVAVMTNWDAFAAFLKGPITLDTDGWQLTPQLRWLLAAGPPIVYAYDPIINVRLSTRYAILQSRRSKLCQVG